MGLLVVVETGVVVLGTIMGVMGSGSTKIQCLVLVLSVTFSVSETEVEVVVPEVVSVVVPVVVVWVNSSLADAFMVCSASSSFTVIGFSKVVSGQGSKFIF